MQIYDTFWRKNDDLKTLYFAYVFHRYDMYGNQQNETENTYNIHTRTPIVSDRVLRQKFLLESFRHVMFQNYGCIYHFVILNT